VELETVSPHNVFSLGSAARVGGDRAARGDRTLTVGQVRIAIVGLGNCASSLVQGLTYYRNVEPQAASGLMHWEIGGYRPHDLQVVAAFDVDVRKVGKDVAEAIFEKPNCTATFCAHIPKTGVRVRMGRVLDGVSEHMARYPDERRFLVSDQREADREALVEALREARAEILVNYLPVGSERATRFYAECALEAGVALVNCIPVFVASDPAFAARFQERGLPIIGDDIKAQLGATITHRMLTDLFRKRGVHLDRTYQLNTGGNTDFLNMLNQSRLASKRVSKTEAVQSVAAERIADENIHVGPSDYVAWQNDNKVCFLRMEGRLFGDVPMHLELRLSVEDSPNSAGVSIDAIRCVKLALDRGLAGPVLAPAAYFMKHPPQQLTDDEAHRRTESFIRGD
jgi:myo-inositol-1-phosphate synthase